MVEFAAFDLVSKVLMGLAIVLVPLIIVRLDVGLRRGAPVAAFWRGRDL